MLRKILAGCAAIGVGTAIISVAAAQEIPTALYEKAEAEPTIRVIARLTVPYRPEQELPEGAAIRQRSMVAAAQAEVARTLEEEPGVELVEAFDTLPLVVLEVDSEGLSALVESGLVESVIEDELAEPLLAQSSPLIHATDAWDAGYRGAGQHVAVLDTGVEATHPFLSGKVVSQACFSTTSSANGGSTSFCPNGQNSQIGADSGRDCDGSVSGCGHGTHVAGIAVGNGPSLSGVAPDANLIAIQVFSEFQSASTCSPRPAPCALSYTSDQIRGLERVQDLAATFTIASANMSLGGGKTDSACDTDPRKATIDALRALRIATVVASGNNGFTDGISFPACISSAISVGSTDKSDNVSGFSNSAGILDLLAPGQSINSSVIGGGVGPKSGTSMATPQVAGAFAVVRSAQPLASVTEILNDLKTNGVEITGQGATKPRLDLAYLAERRPIPEAGQPLAFGTVWFNGAKQKGTPNWTSSYNASFNRYEIDIDGENYFYLNYATVLTPAGDTRFCRSSSVSGKLLVYCYDANGAPATSRFGFVTFKN